MERNAGEGLTIARCQECNRKLYLGTPEGWQTALVLEELGWEQSKGGWQCEECVGGLAARARDAEAEVGEEAADLRALNDFRGLVARQISAGWIHPNEIAILDAGTALVAVARDVKSGEVQTWELRDFLGWPTNDDAL